MRPRNSPSPVILRPFSSAAAADATEAPAQALAQSLVGYQFLTCLERNALGEVWQVRGPDGRAQRAHFLPPLDESRQDAVYRLEAIKHDGLAGFTLLHTAADQFVLLTNEEGITLRDRYQECWTQGLPGIPRGELLAYLRQVAAALDQAGRQHQLRHLALNPRNIFLADNRAKLTGFGLAHALSEASGPSLALLNPRYAAPELQQNRIGTSSDQYSLALIYAEMATGLHPLRPNNPRSRKDPRKRAETFDLTLVCAAERLALERALETFPSRRFENSSELIRALENSLKQQTEPPRPAPGPLLILPRGADVAFHPRLPCGSLDEFVTELVVLAAGGVQVQQCGRIRYTLEPGRHLEHRCPIDFAGTALVRLEGFRQHWQAETIKHEEGLVLFSVSINPGFWQRLVGKRMGLEIQVQVLPGGRAKAQHSEIAVVIRPFGCKRDEAVALLRDLGPKVLESLHAYLQDCRDQRGNERMLVTRPLRISPIFGGIDVAEPIECFTKDISATGIGFFLPTWLPTTQVYVNMPHSELANMAGLAQIVRKQPVGDGWFEIGASFALSR